MQYQASASDYPHGVLQASDNERVHWIAEYLLPIASVLLLTAVNEKTNVPGVPLPGNSLFTINNKLMHSVGQVYSITTCVFPQGRRRTIKLAL